MSIQKECEKVIDELPNSYSGDLQKFSNGESYLNFYCDGVTLYTWHKYSSDQIEYRRVASTKTINALLKKSGSNYRIGNSNTHSSNKKSKGKIHPFWAAFLTIPTFLIVTGLLITDLGNFSYFISGIIIIFLWKKLV